MEALIFMITKEKPTNTFLRNMFSPGYSSLMASFFSTYLTLGFSQHLGKDKKGFDQYCKKSFLSASFNHDGAAFLLMIAMPIVTGKNLDQQVEAVLGCKKNTKLIFEYKPDESNQMTAYLTINKDNQTIPFRFQTRQIKIAENGNAVTKTIQSGLCDFAKVLEIYLMRVGENHLNKLSEDDAPNSFSNTNTQNGFGNF